jgi:ATP-dependent helicase HrpB
VLDEFHERTLETDLALAWLKAARRRGAGPRLVVMSATLDAAGLGRYLPEAVHVDVPGRLFPVDVRHLHRTAPDRLAEGALEALESLAREGLDGSVLVFMPGMREIRRTLQLAGPFCRRAGLEPLPLHGSMELSEQQRVLEPGPGRRLIVATNVAETSLTIPGVTMVVDSGFHRRAGYSPGRGVNTLYLARISRDSARQRAGRAGRTAPGRCVRLWSSAEEASMPESVPPEIRRLELSPLALKAAALPERPDWLTPPDPAALDEAFRTLRGLRAVGPDGGLTPGGRALLRYPVSPRLAYVLEGARVLGPGAYARACAMAAVLETVADRSRGGAADLRELSERVLGEDSEELPWETFEVFRQLRRLDDGGGAGSSEMTLQDLWLEAFGDRLAARIGGGPAYRFADGRKAVLKGDGRGAAAPPLILALDVQETAGAGQAKQVAVSVQLPCDPEEIRSRRPAECRWEESAEFDRERGRIAREGRLMFRGLAIDTRPARPGKDARREDAELWARMLAGGELRLPSRDEKVEQLVTRIRLARRLYPDSGFPEMGEDDWRLILEEVCEGRASLDEIARVPLEPHIHRYMGAGLAGFLDKALPARKSLPSGRSGRFTYYEDQAAELSARLGDFVGMKGTLSLCEGRLPVVFDILAPNHRTVQKTADLTSFWKNTYPSVKKELQRKYPKHPWP